MRGRTRFSASDFKPEECQNKIQKCRRPIKSFSAALEKGLSAGGVPVEVITNDRPVAEDMTLTIKTYVR